MLELNNIYAGYGRTEVLHGVTVHVAKGSLVALIGSNGAGKTTSMRVASGMLTPQAGSIVLEGANITGKTSSQMAHCGIAHVPEGRKIFPSLSVLENLHVGAFTRSRLGRLPPDAHVDLEMVFDRFPRLSERRTQLAGTLSGGEQQMLAIGRGLMAKPKVLLLDEPSMGLAPKLVEDVFNAIKELKAAGVTMLLVEQFAAAALAVADYAYVMETGGIAMHGTAEKLKNDPALKEAYLGKSH